MEQETESPYRQRFWIVILGIVILLVFLYFYRPFENYLSDGIANIHANNIVFWFASLVGVIGYAVAHWQTFRRNMSSQAKTLEVDRLVFDTLQIGILVAVIFSAGAILAASDPGAKSEFVGASSCDASASIFPTNCFARITSSWES